MASKHDVVPSSTPGESQFTITTRGMELVVAGFLMVVAGLVMCDSARVGNGWASDGPEAGYFPFYVGLIMFLASAGNFAINVLSRNPDLSNFVDRSSLVLVLKVLVPTFIYLGVMYFIGIYVASALYIGLFMMWLGKYSLAKTVPVAVLIPLALFWLFEIAFLIPLPKGPLETALGF